MKLINFLSNDEGQTNFGVCLKNHAISFHILTETFGLNHLGLMNDESFFQQYPESNRIAKCLVEKASEHFSELDAEHVYSLDTVRLLPPISSPPALIDFGLSPQHIRDSALTLVKYETKSFVRLCLNAIIHLSYKKNSQQANYRYYKCNHNSIIGDMESPVWPEFSSYLDVEPELGIVVGRAELGMRGDDLKDAIAGYVIFNDFSARDIQFPEMMGFLGPARCKDFERGNGIGPFLVTPDEVSDPLNLEVLVNIGERYSWKGNTSCYSARPIEIVEHLTESQSLKPGTILGMGTVAGCCGLERDEWLNPGELVSMTIGNLGTLRHPIPDNIAGTMSQGRWPSRSELHK